MVKEVLKTKGALSLKEQQKAIDKFLKETWLSIIQATALFNGALNNNSHETSRDYPQDEKAKVPQAIWTVQEKINLQTGGELNKVMIKDNDSTTDTQQDTEERNIRTSPLDIIELHDQLRDLFQKISPTFKVPYTDWPSNIHKLINDRKTNEEACISLYENYIKQLPDYFNTIHTSSSSKYSIDWTSSFDKLIEDLYLILSTSRKESKKISLFVENIVSPIINRAKEAKEALVIYYGTKFTAKATL